jgi:hypothetical protein
MPVIPDGFKASLGKKVQEIPSLPIKSECSGACLSSNYTGSINRRQMGAGIK